MSAGTAGAAWRGRTRGRRRPARSATTSAARRPSASPVAPAAAITATAEPARTRNRRRSGPGDEAGSVGCSVSCSVGCSVGSSVARSAGSDFFASRPRSKVWINRRRVTTPAAAPSRVGSAQRGPPPGRAAAASAPARPSTAITTEPIGRRGLSSRPATTPAMARMTDSPIRSAGLSAVPSRSIVASRTGAGAWSTTESATARNGELAVSTATAAACPIDSATPTASRPDRARAGAAGRWPGRRTGRPFDVFMQGVRSRAPFGPV